MQYKFNTTIGTGVQVVTCTLGYESDASGIYNSTIEKVEYEKHDIASCLTDLTLKELEMEGLQRLEKSL